MQTRGVDDSTVARNRALQAEWYGEPLGDRIQRLVRRLGISQAALAEVLGLSAPMLSQLMTARRAKISNPAVLARLLEAEQAATGFDALTPAQRSEELERIRSVTPRTSSSSFPVERPAPNSAPDPVPAIQALLRAVASADEIEEAARLLDDAFPELAAALRVYGKGRTSEARTHYARITQA